MSEEAGDLAKVVYLALDACDPGLMVELATAGDCPTFAGLLADSAVTETVAPYGTFVGSVWMTLATANRVGRHGYYNWQQIADGGYDVRLTSPREARSAPFWQALSDAGRRIAVFDLPHIDVPTSFNGVVVKEWGCHDRHHGTASFPSGLRDELDAVVGGGHPYGSMVHPAGARQFAPCDYTLRADARRTLDEERRLYDLILDGIDAKREASLHLLEQGGWDLFLDVVGESHCVGHQLWHVHDVDHPRHDPATRQILGDPLVEVYKRLDAVVGDLLDAAGPGVTRYVHLSHGMSAHYDGDHLLDEVLQRIDLLDRETVTTGWRTKAASATLRRTPASMRGRAQSLAAAAIRRRMATSPPTPSVPPVPSADRRWFRVPNNTVVGAMRFNVIGREPSGLVEPDEVVRLTGLVTEHLLELINVDTGRPVVQQVVRAEDVLDRSDGDAFPDLFIEWDRSAPIERVWSPAIGTVYAPYEHWRTGDHHDRGLLLASGEGITPGHRARSMDLIEIAPTLAAALGEELPDVDGRPRLDLVPNLRADDASELTAAPPSMAAPRSAPPRPRSATASDPGRRLAEAALDLAHQGIVTAERADGQTGALAASLHQVAHDNARANLVWSTMRWLDTVTVDEDRLVTVITPTHERPELLAAAIRSVQAQRYQRWEMVVVDDGSNTAKGVLADIGDDRVRVLEVPHGGPAAARNAGLDAATGAVITYLDDDNLLDPGWLKAVVWAFQQRPETEVLYGAMLVDDPDRLHGRGAGGWPTLLFQAFDREILLTGNLVDMGAIAHVAGLPEARFDERLWQYADWDLFLAVTEHRTPLELPAVALCYSSAGDDRLTARHSHDEDLVREKWAAAPPVAPEA